MSITKTIAVDQITVSEDGTVVYREATRLMEDGVQLSKTFHRTSVAPGANLASVPAKVAIVASAAWTPDVVEAYAAKMAESYAAKLAEAHAVLESVA